MRNHNLIISLLCRNKNDFRFSRNKPITELIVISSIEPIFH